MAAQTRRVGSGIKAAIVIMGVVTDKTGEPIQGIGVMLYNDADGDGFWTAIGYGNGTDSTETYRIDSLTAGPYRVGFTDVAMWPQRYQIDCRTGNLIDKSNKPGTIAE